MPIEFNKSELEGLFLISAEIRTDDRGVFVEMFNAEEFSAFGIDQPFNQSVISGNDKKGTVRGLHFQAEPHAQAKLVRCQRGAIFDVAVDLRKQSPSYLKNYSFELNEDDWQWLYLPPGIAHGFCTLTDNTQVAYKISGKYSPNHSSGINWLDPMFDIDWPVTSSNAILSPHDFNLPNFDQRNAYFA